MKKIWIVAAMLASVLTAGCAAKGDTVKLDKNQPVNLTVWHYYNGAQKTAFDALVSEFNETEGKNRGIYVESHSKGDVAELEKAVLSSGKKEVGSEEMPNIFSSYADTAYEIDKAGLLTDLSKYLTAEEQAEYVDSYIEEGKIGQNGELRIFPIAKSTEIFMMNKTVWDEFSSETAVTEEDLKTTEDIVKAAELYYNWTDGKTPDTPNDGKAFYGRDAIANLFIICSRQQGIELFQVENQKVTLNVDHGVFKDIWDTYYVPYVKGYFGAYGRFRSDDVKIGELVAYTGSIASASYFPKQVEIGDSITPIECMVLSPPHCEGDGGYIIQQGAGMVVTKKNDKEEYASIQFLKWFTESENNTEFGCSSGYVPVKKAANEKEVLDKVIKEKNITMSDMEYNTLLMAYDMVKNNSLYTSKAFEGGTKARKVLEYQLSDKAKADREQVEALLANGMGLEEAVSGFVSEESFELWFADINRVLEDCVKDGNNTEK